MFSAVTFIDNQRNKTLNPSLPWNIFSKNSPLYWYNGIKRLTDIIISATLLLAFIPIFLILSILILATSRGPVFLSQKRLTIGGRIFSMYKFRTMLAEAEAKSGPVWCSKHDKRVTPIGQILRRTRLDELPQLINVLRGEMSLIGPRPERPELATILTTEFPEFSKRLAVKGGISGLAQVRLGYAADMKHYRRKLAMDLIYIKNRCLLLDLRIAISTIFFFLQVLTNSLTPGKY